MNVERFLNVWHNNGVQIMPCSPDGFPSRLEGKEAIRCYYDLLSNYYKLIRFSDRIFHFTTDPARVWVELRCEIQIKAMGKACKNSYACLFILRGAQIIEYKEYTSLFTLLTPFCSSKMLRKNLKRSSKP